MSNLENKLKKIIYAFNNVNRDIAFKDIKKLSEKYSKNIIIFYETCTFRLITIPNQ